MTRFCRGALAKVYLAPGIDFTFLGVTIEKLPHGILLHQNTYTELLLEEHQSSIPTQPRWTTGEAEHFLLRPKWTILVHFGLVSAKIWFGIRSF